MNKKVREVIAGELVKVAKDLIARDIVKDVMREMKELDKLGVEIPRGKYNKNKIMNFFKDIDSSIGGRELSLLIDSYINR